MSRYLYSPFRMCKVLTVIVSFVFPPSIDLLSKQKEEKKHCQAVWKLCLVTKDFLACGRQKKTGSTCVSAQALQTYIQCTLLALPFMRANHYE